MDIGWRGGEMVIYCNIVYNLAVVLDKDIMNKLNSFGECLRVYTT